MHITSVKCYFQCKNGVQTRSASNANVIHLKKAFQAKPPLLIVFIIILNNLNLSSNQNYLLKL